MNHLGHELTTRPERLAERELGQLLSAVGNHEAKGALYLILKEGLVYNNEQLNRIIKDAQDGVVGYQPNQRAYLDYAVTFAQLGLGDLVPTPEGRRGYIKPHNIHADALAGGLLDISLKNDEISLSHLLGPTQSAGDKIAEGVRSPLRRLNVAAILLAAPEGASNKEIADICGDDYDSMTHHLRRFAELDLISYESDTTYLTDPLIKVKKPIADYTWKKSLKSLTQKSAEGIMMLSEGRPIPRSQLLKYLRQMPVYNTQQQLTSNTMAALRDLERQGFIELEGVMSQPEHSAAWLNEEQKKLWQEIVELVLDIQNGDPKVMDGAIRKGQEIAGSPNLIREAIEKGFSRSSQTRIGTKPNAESIVLGALVKLGPITSRELSQSLQVHGLSRSTIQTALYGLKTQGFATSTKKSSYHIWSAGPGEAPGDSLGVNS